MARIVFWLSFGFVFYVYAGYPLLLMLWRLAAARRISREYVEPFVTLLLTAHNERETIADKIANCLQQDYPADRLQFIVSLDGPSDGTDQIVRSLLRPGILLVHCEQHQGKAAAINRAMAYAIGDVVVFVDARQRLDSQAIRELVASFAEDAVGAVSGELVVGSSTAGDSKESGDAVGIYWRYEKWIRAMESDIHSAAGASGALYAVRRSLFRPIPADTILDDVAIPMEAVLAGKRLLFEPAAKAYDAPAASPQAEFARKVRTLTGNFQLLARKPVLLLPWRNPIFFQFVSHKVGRLMVPYGLVALFISNLFLWEPVYIAALVLQLAWYLLALAGGLVARETAPPARTKTAKLVTTSLKEDV